MRLTPGRAFALLTFVLSIPVLGAAGSGIGLISPLAPSENPDGILLWPCLVTALSAGVLSAWIFALKPGDGSARLFALSGVATYAFSMGSAGFYLPVTLSPEAISALVLINVVGACGFGLAMIALFSRYPRRLRYQPVIVWLSVIIFSGWTLYAYLGPPQVFIDIHRITLAQMLLIIGLAGAQFIASRHNPVDRNIALWIGTCVAIGAGGFIGLVALPSALLRPPVIPNPVGFLFFILVYVGLAVGLMRLRVFGLGRWSYQLLFNVGAALLVVLLDVVLIAFLALDAGTAIGASLFLVALLYLPARAWLWERISRKKRAEDAALFQGVADVALQPTSEKREAAWRDLLMRHFAPLEVNALAPGALPGETLATIGEEGRQLNVRSPLGFAPLTLRDKEKGRELFSKMDAETARELASLVHDLNESRTAYDRGAAFERSRIARDIHDNIGAQLLTALHARGDERKDALIRDTIGDLRAVIQNAEGETPGFEALLADMRAETADRLELAGLAMVWNVGVQEASAPSRAMVSVLRAILREAVSNVIRHAAASTVTIRLSAYDDMLQLSIADDGQGFETDDRNEGAGRGLRNMRERVESLGGELTLQSGAGGTSIAAEFPLSPGVRDAAR